MMPARYVRNLQTFRTGIDGVHAIRHSRFPSSTRFVCSYEDGQRHKVALFAILQFAGQVEPPGGWEWHHVVERQHYADVDHRGQLESLYLRNLPCVLLVASEHRAYNGQLHSRESKLLFRDPTLPKDMQVRARTVADAALQNRTLVRTRIGALRSLYHDAYDGDDVLITIADNVFDELLESW